MDYQWIIKCFVCSILQKNPYHLLIPHGFCDQKTQLGGTLFQAGPRNAPGALELFASQRVELDSAKIVTAAGEIDEKPLV